MQPSMSLDVVEKYGNDWFWCPSWEGQRLKTWDEDRKRKKNTIGTSVLWLVSALDSDVWAGLLCRATWDENWSIDWAARSRRCESMVQIISEFTEATLHRLPPLLCNPSSPWRTAGSHGSRGKHKCKYYFALRSAHTHERISAQTPKGQIQT